MKKQYISPEVLCHQIHLGNLLNDASVTIDSGDLTHPIENGGDAGDGEGSDSRRRRDIWADEEEDEYAY